ncbi:MAG: hypothetical protein ACO1OB_27715 [Archangium sp.]
MRAIVMLSASLLCVACKGPLDVGDWKGTWSGNAVINTGRQPEVYEGTLIIDDTARFEAKSAAIGGRVFTCALAASEIDVGGASFTTPTSCAMTASPADDCTYEVTFNNASATRDGEALQAMGNGRFTSTCTQSSSQSLDFALTLSATRK